MRSDWTKKQAITARAERFFRDAGASVHSAYRIITTKLDGCIDLLVEFRGQRIACEIEMSAECLKWDIAKARAVRATVLLVVVPNEELAETARSRLAGFKACGLGPLGQTDCLTIEALLRRRQPEHLLPSRQPDGKKATDETETNTAATVGAAVGGNI